MEEIYVAPENLKTSYYRRALKFISKMFKGGVILNYSPKITMKELNIQARQAKVGIYVPKSKAKEAKSILRSLGFKIVPENQAVGILDETIIMSLLSIENEVSVPIGIDISGDHLVMLPLKRVLMYGYVDYRFPIYLARIMDVCWIDTKGFRPRQIDFTHIDKIPIGSTTRYALRELSRVIASVTIGERYASEVFNALTSGGDELFQDEEVPLLGRETEALREVLGENGILSREAGRLRGKIYVDVSHFGAPAIISAIAATLLNYPGFVIINSEVWHPSLLPLINRREGLFWVSRNPAMQLVKEFEVRIFHEGDHFVLSKLVEFEGELREVRERFIPLWEVKTHGVGGGMESSASEKQYH